MFKIGAPVIVKGLDVAGGTLGAWVLSRRQPRTRVALARPSQPVCAAPEQAKKPAQAARAGCRVPQLSGGTLSGDRATTQTLGEDLRQRWDRPSAPLPKTASVP